MTDLSLTRGVDRVVNPRTGELITLDEATTSELADVRAALTVLSDERQRAVRMVDEEIVRRTDESLRRGEIASHTFTVPGFRVQVDTGTKRLYDSNALRKDLLQRKEHGELRVTAQAIERAFVTRQWYLQLKVWDTLCKVDPDLRAIGEMHCTPARRTVKVTPLLPTALEGTAEDDWNGDTAA